jgi:hypothetical protein
MTSGINPTITAIQIGNTPAAKGAEHVRSDFTRIVKGCVFLVVRFESVLFFESLTELSFFKLFLGILEDVIDVYGQVIFHVGIVRL